jgi:hypothetical protein
MWCLHSRSTTAGSRLWVSLLFLGYAGPTVMAAGATGGGAGGTTICTFCSVAEISCNQTIQGTLAAGDCELTGTIYIDVFRLELAERMTVEFRLSSSAVAPKFFLTDSDCGALQI